MIKKNKFKVIVMVIVLYNIWYACTYIELMRRNIYTSAIGAAALQLAIDKTGISRDRDDNKNYEIKNWINICKQNNLELIFSSSPNKTLNDIKCYLIGRTNDDANLPIKYAIVKSKAGSIMGAFGFIYCCIFWGSRSDTYMSLATTSYIFSTHRDIITNSIDNACSIIPTRSYCTSYGSFKNDRFNFDIYDVDSGAILGNHIKNSK